MYQFGDIGAGAGGSAAALRAHPAFNRPTVGRNFGARAAARPRLELVADLGVREAIAQNVGLARRVNVTDGKLTYQAVAEAHSLDYSPLGDLLPLESV